jgi:excisionase family DNA binding protein
MPTDTLNIMQAAKIVGTSDKTIRRAIHAGKLKATFPQPNQAVIKLKDLEKYIASRQVGKDVQVSAPVQASVQSPDLEQRVIELEAMVQALGERVGQLEQLLSRSLEVKPVKPVELAAFATLHNVSSTDYQRAINMDALPVKNRKGGAVLLDGKSQLAFYQLFRELPSFVACPDCPHGYV